MNKCFAYKNDDEEGFRCTALDTDICPGKACRFFKTDKQCAEEKERTQARLNALPSDKRAKIKKKYGI